MRKGNLKRQRLAEKRHLWKKKMRKGNLKRQRLAEKRHF